VSGFRKCLIEILRRSFAPEDRSRPWEWAARTVRIPGSPLGDRFLIEETPWLKLPLECLDDITLLEIVMRCCAQGGKSVTLQVGCAWALDRQPDPTMYVLANEKMAKHVATQKLNKILESVPSLAASMPAEKTKKKQLEVHFPNAVLMIGPANESFLRSHTIRWMWGDECSDWAPGKMEQARARLRRFWNRKAFFASTPLKLSDDFTNAYNDGTQEEYHLVTPCCEKPIYVTTDNFEKLFKWAENQETRPGGDWDFPKLEQTVELVCPHCQARHKQTDENMDAMYRKMIARAVYIAKNPKAARSVRSFAFNWLVLAPSLLKWSDVVIKWLKAKVAEGRGDLAPMRELVNLFFAEPFDERKFISVQMPSFADYTPDPEKAWEKEKYRFLTVDCQKDLAEFWAVVRAWSADGSSRLLAFEKLRSEAEIEELRIKWKVLPARTGIDCGYEMYRVFEMCVRNGWVALRGEDKQDYTHEDKVKRPYSIMYKGDPRTGKSYAGRVRCPLFYWSNPSIKDLLWNLKSGKGSEWLVPDLGSAILWGERDPKKLVYAEGVDSERKIYNLEKDSFAPRWTKIRRANHPWDAECMQVVYAYMGKCFGA
jgi:hypothetical protein